MRMIVCFDIAFSKKLVNELANLDSSETFSSFSTKNIFTKVATFSDKDSLIHKEWLYSKKVVQCGLILNWNKEGVVKLTAGNQRKYEIELLAVELKAWLYIEILL